MRYLNVYYDYLKLIDKKKNELGTYLAAKEDENSYKIIYLTEIKGKIYNWIIIANVILMVFAGLIYSFVKEYFEIKDMIYYLYFVIVVNIGLIISIFVFKYKIKQLKMKENTETAQKLKDEYRKECEKIYQICPFLIVINEYYYELLELSIDDRLVFYKEKVKEVQKNINFNSDGMVNTQTYVDYLENYIIKNKE